MKGNTKGIYYRLIDHYSLFYLSWMAPIKQSLMRKGLSNGYWDKVKHKPAWASWAGLTFESICYEHLPQIMRALNLSSTAMPGTWRYVARKEDAVQQGAQIDLLFDRDDHAITVCEIKYTDKPFVITKAYAESLQKKVETFKRIVRTDKQLFVALISASGVKKNKYSESLIDAIVTLDDLFKEG